MPGTRKILIIDDEIDLCFLLKDYFIRMNFEVRVAHSLAEGTALLVSQKPAVLFIDNNLPDGSGWNYASEVAANNPDICFILFGAMGVKVPEMPVDSDFKVLIKPVSIADLDKQFMKFR